MALTGNWEGDRVPDPTVDAFVRHGTKATLLGNSEVDNLLVDEQTSVSTFIHPLNVHDTTT